MHNRMIYIYYIDFLYSQKLYVNKLFIFYYFYKHLSFIILRLFIQLGYVL